jgi:hypothetical protein
MKVRRKFFISNSYFMLRASVAAALIGQAGEPIISAASADHKKAPGGFTLSPWKLIATTARARTLSNAIALCGLLNAQPI